MRTAATVVVVGCGAAGVTAALGLARRGIKTLVIEGAAYPGAENWSGAVYFCETLARPEILGPELLKQCAFERRVVKRGLLVSDGVVAVGGAVRSPAAFEHAYTVLRPVFDRDLAEKARMLGAEILSNTTAIGLIRDGDRVRGVMTSRGPVWADLVFLAEGDASHIVSREGLERVAPSKSGVVQPEFLQGVKEVLALPAAEIEKRFGVAAGEGACYEILLRNGTFDGKTVPLNAGAFLYTNRDSISLGFVAPLANLSHFGGDHNTLMEWLKGLAPLRGLLEGATPISFGAKLIRGGGHREMPTLCLDGLVVGGAAAGLGVDFPCPNYTGPATHCGWLVSEAVHSILQDGGTFDRATLEARYVEPLKQSVGYRDSVHLSDWPHAISGAREFFGRQCDLVAGTASILADPEAGVVGRHFQFARHLVDTLPFGVMLSFGREMARVGSALRADRGMLGAIGAHVPAWILNTLRPMVPVGSSTGATFEPVFLTDPKAPRLAAPFSIRYFLWRHGNALADALHHLYANDGRDVGTKLVAARRSVIKTLSLIEVLLVPLMMLMNVALGWMHRAAFYVWVAATRPKLDAILATYPFKKKEERRRANDWRRVKDVVPHDDKLAAITYRGDHDGHIGFHVRPDKNGLPETASPVFSVCPARVYREERDQSLARSVAVLHENCVRCETCWRADPEHIDWGRTRGQRLVFEAYSPAEAWTAESVDAAAIAWLERRGTTAWAQPVPTVSDVVVPDESTRARLATWLARVRVAVAAFRPLHAGVLPILLGADQDLLAKTAEDGFRSVERLVDLASPAAEGHPELRARLDAMKAFVSLARPRVAGRRFFDLEADFDLLATHHLPDLEARLSGIVVDAPRCADVPDVAADRTKFRRALEAHLGKEVIAACESGGVPVPEARKAIAWALRAVSDAAPRGPAVQRALRAVVLEEIGRLAPGLAYVAAGARQAADLMADAASDAAVAVALKAARDGNVTVLAGEIAEEDGALAGTCEATLACGAEWYVVARASGGFALVRASADGVVTEAPGALGLLSGQPARVVFDGVTPAAVFGDAARRRAATVAAATDAASIARGMTAYMAERALDHAMSRVQFPGLFRDVRGRDGLAKFGAVQAMLAGITASRHMMATLARRGVDDVPAWGVVSEWLAPGPRSVAYLSGQVLGGTAYSEEDPVCRLYRDASAMTRLPFDTEEIARHHGRRFVRMVGSAEPRGATDGVVLPSLRRIPVTLAVADGDPDWIAEDVRRWKDASVALFDAVRGMDDASREAVLPQVGRLALLAAALVEGLEAVRESARRGTIEPIAVGSLQWFGRRFEARVRKFAMRAADVPAIVELGRTLLTRGAEEGPSGARGATYAEYLAAPTTFKSGDSVVAPSAPGGLVYGPELLDADPGLAALEAESVADFRARFRTSLFDGRSYPRHVEHLHHVPLEDIAWLVDTGRFRMVIPKEEGGLGMDKASYYVVCRAMMRFGDPAQSLIVMGSTSIGTTPFLIGLEQDLPAARASFAKAASMGPAVTDLATRAGTIVGMLGGPDALKVKEPFEALMAASKKVLGGDKALRPIFGKFQDALLAAGKAGLKKDGPGMAKALKAASDALAGWEERLAAEAAVLPHREAMLRFWLRQIAQGRISAFALTEPSAGSDTARIRTRAERVEVPCVRDPRGFWVFTPAGGSAARNLFTPDSFVFDGGTLWFVAAGGARHAVVQRDFTFDPKPGEPSKHRYVEVDGARIDIHDIGAVRSRASATVYPYWRTNGAKMWITNGTVAGVMALYARTPKGPSAFILDAHAEGLAIGKDEHKMGQRGSSTNELALNDVRIPEDALVGIEGRGQENALETLNVGRAGLAFTVSGIMHDVVGDVRECLAKAWREPRPSDFYEFGKIAMDVVGAETVAFQLVGRFDHEGTESIRMESAIGKAESAEAFHRVIRRAERICGRRGVLADLDLEKRRRDARVITIYEGTNEIQRFLLSKDLIDVLDVKALGADGPVSTDADLSEVWSGFTAGRRALATRVADLRTRLGARAWQEVHLQPWIFPLVEGFMQLSVLGAVALRLETAKRLCAADATHPRMRLLSGVAKALAASAARLAETRFAEFDVEGARIAKGHGPLAQWIADRALAAHGPEVAPKAAAPQPAFDGPRRVLVVVDPRPAVAPRPRVRDGRLGELLFELAPDDRAAVLEAVRQRAGGSVTVTVLGVGGPASASVLEEALALGADDAVLIDTEHRPLLAVDIAACVAEWIGFARSMETSGFDAVVGSESSVGLLLPLARRLGAESVRRVATFALRGGADSRSTALRLAEPALDLTAAAGAVLLMDAEVGITEADITIEGWASASAKPMTVIGYTPRTAEGGRLDAVGRGGGGEARADGPLSAASAAQRFGELAGVGAASGGTTVSTFVRRDRTAREGPLSGVTHLVVVGADADGGAFGSTASLLDAAAALAARSDGKAAAWVVVGAEAAAEAALSAHARPGVDVMVLVEPASRGAPDYATSTWLEALLGGYGETLWFGPEWRGVGLLVGEAVALRHDGPTFDGMDRVTLEGAHLRLSGLRHDGRTQFSVSVSAAAACTIIARAELAVDAGRVSLAPAHAGYLRGLPAFPVDPMTDALRAAQSDLGVASLADADFIIDVGYGVGSRDGLELVVEPLKAGLERLGVKKVMVGASRKVTLDLGILPDELQIGQTGITVNPKVVLALGISGAPQHMNYIGERAVIFAFNRDPDAPIFAFNRSRPKPQVLPVPGDLFVEVPRFLRALEAAVAVPV